MTFGGSSIFGTQVRQLGPVPAYRSQDAYLPGVDGGRVYRMGKSPQTWTVSGRLTSTSIAALTGLLAASQAFLDGRLYTFVDNGGTAYTNCQLTAFAPSGQVETAVSGGLVVATVRYTATIRQMTP